MAAQTIKITGARQHNLKNLTLEIPREKLVVITGLSGSGKSSLAFDTLYAEGQRRYVESLSAYARQFLDQMQKPDVDFIEGLSPAIAIEQRTSGGNPALDHRHHHGDLRLSPASLFLGRAAARSRTPARRSRSSPPQQIVDHILAGPPESRIVVLAPIVHDEVGEFRDVLEKLKREGFVRVRVDGEIVELSGQHAAGKAAERPGASSSRRSWTGSSFARACAAARGLGRYRAEMGRQSSLPCSGALKIRRRRSRGLGRDQVLHRFQQSRDRLHAADAHAEAFLVQQPPRRMPRVPWLGNGTALRRAI